MSGNGVKIGGGTRNYSKAPSTLAARKAEFNRKMATGEYDENLSYFDKSGGYVLVHKHHNKRKPEDREDLASRALASKGYVVELADERSYISNDTKGDGFLYKSPMDIKTISTAGKNTMKARMEDAAGQNAKVAIIMQNTPNMDRGYVESQIDKFQRLSPKKCREQLEYVIVVGMSGDVHRRKLK